MTLYRQLTQHCGQDAIGVHGLSQVEIDGLLTGLAKGLKELKERKNKGANPLLALPVRTDDLEVIESVAETIRRRFAHVIVVGSGGSGLSGKALLAVQPCATPSFEFLDNIDPHMQEDVLARVAIETTGFIFISKSGTTVETLSQLYALAARVKQVGGRSAIATQFIAVTSREANEGDNPMRALAREYGFRVLDHDEDVGGRFSILSMSGLLTAAIAGIDIRAFRAGAQTVVEALDHAEKPADFAPAIGAALQHGFSQRSRNISVLMPYSERLSGLAAWYRQSWAESLGKDGKGTTPVAGMGTTDQHSQLQLYLGGPKDKLFHIVTLKRAGSGDIIELPDRAELAYMKGKTIGDIMEAQQKATIETLVANRCPVRVFELDELSVKSFGALIMHFTFEIILMSYLLEVNPFDQPAVEDSKNLARKYLSDSQ